MSKIWVTMSFSSYSFSNVITKLFLNEVRKCRVAEHSSGHPVCGLLISIAFALLSATLSSQSGRKTWISCWIRPRSFSALTYRIFSRRWGPFSERTFASVFRTQQPAGIPPVETVVMSLALTPEWTFTDGMLHTSSAPYTRNNALKKSHMWKVNITWWNTLVLELLDPYKQVYLMVLIYVEDTVDNCSTVHDGHYNLLIGLWDFHQLHVALTLVYFFGTAFIRFLLWWKSKVFLRMDFIA